ncbi:MAG: DsbA family protein [Pseudomonadales bacterium]|jgi:2-hydroxychromene-2-carboxylate isomerase|nr:DsbA family protein [Pseudomonadales bacterium]
MTIAIDLYYTMRSPYCYLAAPSVADIVEKYDLVVRLKPVYPLAVSDPTFFEKVNPLWPPYLQKDTKRIAQRLNLPFRWPRPDPIVQDMTTRKVAQDQPYIRRLTHFAQIAAERDKGLDYVVAVSALLYNPEIDAWDQGDHLRDAMAQAGLDLSEFEGIAINQAARLESAVAANREAQLATGHWGAPLFVHAGEIFFGQDRIVDLVWYLERSGLQTR